MFKKGFLVRFVSIFLIPVFLFSLSPNSSAQIDSTKSHLTFFSNSAPININTASGLTAPTVAATYPSAIEVSGMSGNITKVEVTLRGITHGQLHNLDFLLVSPSGAKYIFLSDSLAAANDSFFTFSDSGTSTLVSGFGSGTYLPTNFNTGTDTFPASAPSAPYSTPPGDTFASVFNGSNPNGTWNLYAVDDSLGFAGSIVSGWSLSITTNGAPQTFSNFNNISFNDIITPSAPFGTSINVSGQTGVISDLNVTINGFSHAAPGDVDILLVSPNGKSLLLMSDISSSSVSNIQLTFDDSALGTINTTPTSGTYKPTGFYDDVTDFFSAPAPLTPYHAGDSFLSNFNGFNPNGEWRLFVTDDTQNNAGAISGGWSLDITTVPNPPPPPLNCSGPTFTPSSFQTGVNPTNMAVADFNNDTKADVAVTNQVSNNVSILLGNGNGTFNPQTLISVGSNPYSIVAAKFNSDNNFDLAVVNSFNNNVSVLLGNGNGTFSAPANFFVGATPISIDAADFNGDGKQDLAVANFGGFFAGSVSILLGNGNGGFSAGNSVRTRTQPAFVKTALLNGDSLPDLAVANFGANSFSTFINTGNANFVLSQNVNTGAGPVAIEIADFGTDGIADIAVANYNSDTITTCSGSSSGIFSGCSTTSIGQNPVSITSGDFVGAGVRSTATALSGSNTVRLGGDNVPTGLNPNAVKSADLNGDGKLDMITVNSGSNDLSVLINGCLTSTGNIFDYDGNRRTDYAVFRSSTRQYFVQGLSGNSSIAIFGRATDKLVPADYNGDRRTDIGFYRPESGLWFILQNNSLMPIHFQQFGLPDDIPTPADFDGDSKADIAVFRPSNGTWYIRRSSDNSLQIAQFGANGDKPVAADFDGDNIDDLGIFRPSEGTWYIRRSSDLQITIAQFGINEDKTVVGDYDGDGKADIAVWRPSQGVWYVLKSSDGNFLIAPWGFSTDIPIIGDYEGDGKYDFAVYRPSQGTWYISKSSDGGIIGFQWGNSTDIPIPNAFVR